MEQAQETYQDFMVELKPDADAELVRSELEKIADLTVNKQLDSEALGYTIISCSAPLAVYEHLRNLLEGIDYVEPETTFKASG